MPSEESKDVKKEKFNDDDGKSLGSLQKNKKKHPKSRSPSKPKFNGELSVAKNLKNEDENIDSKVTDTKKSASKVNKDDTNNADKKKSVRGAEQNGKKKKKKGNKGAEQNYNKKEKKMYDLPGQKRDSPDERDPLRIFYETLYKQVPESELAAFWMMECGLLPKDVAKDICQKKMKRKEKPKVSSPMKSVVTVKKTAKSVTVKEKTSSTPVSSTKKKKTPDLKAISKPTKKRKASDDSLESDESDDDIVISIKAKRQKV